MRYLPLILLLLVACEAPPTQEQATTRAIRRNCEAQGVAAANRTRQQSAQAVEQGSATNQVHDEAIEAKALEAQQKAFKSCMLKYAL